jgi:hypothetical protein
MDSMSAKTYEPNEEMVFGIFCVQIQLFGIEFDD